MVDTLVRKNFKSIDPTGNCISVMDCRQIESAGQEKNITNYIPKQDPEMKQFEKLMRGHKLED